MYKIYKSKIFTKFISYKKTKNSKNFKFGKLYKIGALELNKTKMLVLK